MAPSPRITSFFDPLQPQVLLLVNIDVLECSLCNNWNNHQVLDVNLDLDNFMCVYEDKHLLDFTKDSLQLDKTLDLQKRHTLLSLKKPFKDVLRVSFIY